MDTSAIGNRYTKHKVLYEDLKQAFEKAKIEIAFPIFHEVQQDFAERTSLIFESMLREAAVDNVYSCFILYRSLLEHFYKSIYLVDKTVITKSDETAEKYQKHYFISEFLAEKAGVLEMEDLVNNAKEKTNFINFITKKMPEMQGFDKANQQEISTAIRQFNLKEIVKYLFEEYKTRKGTQNTFQIVAQTLPEYSFVSTFTHGGAYAAVLLRKFRDSKEVHTQLSRILEIALTSTCVTKENLFMTFKIDKSFEEYLFQLQNIRSAK